MIFPKVDNNKLPNIYNKLFLLYRVLLSGTLFRKYIAYGTISSVDFFCTYNVLRKHLEVDTVHMFFFVG